MTNDLTISCLENGIKYEVKVYGEDLVEVDEFNNIKINVTLDFMERIMESINNEILRTR